MSHDEVKLREQGVLPRDEFARGDVVQIADDWPYPGGPHGDPGSCYVIVTGPRERRYADEYDDPPQQGSFLQYVGLEYARVESYAPELTGDELLFHLADYIEQDLEVRFIDGPSASLVPSSASGVPECEAVIEAYWDRRSDDRRAPPRRQRVKAQHG